MIFYHLVSPLEWSRAVADGVYTPSSLSAEGFIHLSLATQVKGSLARYFLGKTDTLLLEIDGSRLTAEVRFDPVRDETFPHLYGPLNLAAVVRTENAADAVLTR